MAAALLVAMCTTVWGEDGWRREVHPKLHYAVGLPPDWVEQVQGRLPQVTLTLEEPVEQPKCVLLRLVRPRVSALSHPDAEAFGDVVQPVEAG